MVYVVLKHYSTCISFQIKGFHDKKVFFNKVELRYSVSYIGYESKKTTQ